MAKSDKSQLYYCEACGHETSKWLGRCPECSEWGSFDEVPRGAKSDARRAPSPVKALPLSEVEMASEPRIATGMQELDRVLGGGMVPGSLILVGGDPGIGKSTLMLQALGGMAARGMKALYVTGEESPQQIKMRAKRLELDASDLLLLAAIELNQVEAVLREQRPQSVVIDSIQTAYLSQEGGSPGSTRQLRESALLLMNLSRELGFATFLIGHVTKEGAIAGPKILEHIVDTVLYFEGEGALSHRVIRAHKNRYGSVSEIGVFEMSRRGLREVANPSELFMSGRKRDVPGSIITCTMNGTRPLLVEIQALLTQPGLGAPRRTTLGFDRQRASLLAAVVDRVSGSDISQRDLYINVAGGFHLEDPGVDLGVACSLISNLRNIPVDGNTLVVGEVGLTGEVRMVSHIERRLAEAGKLGFSHCLLPKANIGRLAGKPSLELTPVTSLQQTLARLFGA